MKTLRILAVAAGMAAALFTTNAFAQDHQGGADRRADWKEKMEAQKVAFITNAVSLTTEEAQAFWPVYNKVSEKRDAAIKETRTLFFQLQKAVKENSADKDIKTLLDKYIKALEDSKKVEAEAAQEFRKVLSESKVAKVFIAEEMFRKSQIGRMNGGHGQHPQGGQHQQGGFHQGGQHPQGQHQFNGQHRRPEAPQKEGTNN